MLLFRLLGDCLSSPESAKLCFHVTNAECYTLLCANHLMPTGFDALFVNFGA